MAVTLGSTGITFPDATTQTTAATGGGAIRATFTAAAAITAGNVVQFTTGTNVTPVTGAVYEQTLSGVNTVLSNGNAGYGNDGTITVAYDPNTAGSFVTVSRSQNGQNLTIVAGTTSVDTTTVGSVVTVALAGTSQLARFYTLKAMFDPVTAGKVLVIAVDGTNSTSVSLVKAWIFTVSGTTVTLQSNTTLFTGGATVRSTFSYYGQDIFVYTYSNNGNPQAVACSISTYTITQGTATTLAARVPDLNGYLPMDMDYSPLISNTLGFVQIGSSNNDVYAVAFTVNPATKVITAGSELLVIAGTYTYASISFDPYSSRFAVGSGSSVNQVQRIYMLGFSGTTLSGPTLIKTIAPICAFVYKGIAVKFFKVTDGSSANSVLGYSYSGSVPIVNACCITVTFHRQYWATGIASGPLATASFTWQDEGLIYNTSTAIQFPFILPLSQVSGQTQKIAFPYGDTSLHRGLLRLGTAKATTTNLDSTKVIGIANASASAAASVVVNLWGGISTNQSGLTPNTTYYVDVTGALTTSSTAPNLSMGKALTASTILLKTAP